MIEEAFIDEMDKIAKRIPRPGREGSLIIGPSGARTRITSRGLMGEAQPLHGAITGKKTWEKVKK
jgi:hypothetical protein